MRPYWEWQVVMDLYLDVEVILAGVGRRQCFALPLGEMGGCECRGRAGVIVIVPLVL